MNQQELKEFLEGRGYEVRSIRIFPSSFHVTVWTKEYKLTAYMRGSLTDIPSKPDGSTAWLEFSKHFPRGASS